LVKKLSYFNVFFNQVLDVNDWKIYIGKFHNSLIFENSNWVGSKFQNIQLAFLKIIYH